MGAGHRIANHSVQMLDGMELFLGKDARREALLHLLCDAKFIPNEHIDFILNDKIMKTKNEFIPLWKQRLSDTEPKIEDAIIEGENLVEPETDKMKAVTYSLPISIIDAVNKHAKKMNISASKLVLKCITENLK